MVWRQTPSRTWKLCCDTVDDVKDWIFAIEVAKKTLDMIVQSGATVSTPIQKKNSGPRRMTSSTKAKDKR